MGTEGGSNQDSTRLLIEEFTSKFTSSLSQILAQNNQLIAQNNPPPPSKPPEILVPLENPNSHIAVKFTGKNYRIWSQVAEMHIASREKLGHIDGTMIQPKTDAPEYKRWKTDDVVVKSWLINSLDESLIGDFIRYPTAKEVWDTLASTFFDGDDYIQFYELRRKVGQLKQFRNSIETYYHSLQGLWKEMDFRRPNPMTSPNDIEKHNQLVQEERVYTFLDGLDDHLDGIRADVLKTKPFPTVEQAYAMVRREENRKSVMMGKVEVPSVALISEGAKPYLKNSGAAVPQNNYLTKEQKRLLKCTNPKCLGTGHTKDMCFKIVGYPEWWHEVQRKKKGRGATANFTYQHSTETKEQRSPGASTSAPAATGTTEQVAAAHLSLMPPPSGSGEGKSYCQSNKQTNLLSNWIVDSGASDHMTYDPGDFVQAMEPKKVEIINANGGRHPVTGAGKVQLTSSIALNNTLLVPSLSTKLLSVGQLAEELNCVVLMYPRFCLFQDVLSKEIIGRGSKRGGLYHMDDISAGRINYVKGKESTLNLQKIMMWHKRLGHPSFSYMRKLVPEIFQKCDIQPLECETCIKAKSHRNVYPLSNNKSTIPFALVHSDVWGPSPVNTMSGNKYYVLFVDDFSRMTWLYLFKRKDEVAGIFKLFHKMVLTQFNREIKIFRSDNGGEFVNNTLKEYFASHGVVHETSCVGTPQQNGVAERKNRHILETARSLLFENNVPKKFWEHAITTSIYLINRMPSKKLNFQTPLQVLSLHHHIPSILTIPPKIFGCVAYVHIQKQNRTKLDPCAEKCIFLGYGFHQKGYKCYNPITRKFFVTMDVNFLESESFFPRAEFPVQGERDNDHETLDWEYISGPSFSPRATASEVKNLQHSHSSEIPYISELTPIDPPSEPNQSNPHISEAEATPELVNDTIVQNGVDSENDVTRGMHSGEDIQSSSNDELSSPSPEEHPEVRISTPEEQNIVSYKLPFRHNRGKPPNRYEPEYEPKKPVNYPIANYVNVAKLSEKLKGFVANLSSVRVPERVEEALGDSRWREAMDVEMAALDKNKTWRVVELPKGKKPVGCKWVFSIKYNANGEIERYKARLVAKGYTQKYGIDFQETFSPVAKLNTIRILISLAANLGWSLHQFDVKNAFLHGDLEEEIYMELPPGYDYHGSSSVVCKLDKALYGLKQSPRAWFGRFSGAMKKYGYNQSDSDHTLFIRRNGEKLTLLIIYVDDMIITGNDEEEITELQEKLSKEFEMKNLGKLKYFLGIEVARSNEGIFLSQRKYVLDFLAEVGMLDCKPVDTPIMQNYKSVEHTDSIPEDKENYQKLVGKLIYLSHTRPDIAYAVSVASQFMHSPKQEHMELVTRIIRYLKGSPGRGVMYKNNGNLDVCGYTDADWAGSQVDRRSTSGYFTFVGGNLVTWRSKKQNVVALSSAEAEFRGMTKGMCELLWIQKLMIELGYPPRKEMDLFCDNKAAIDISQNPVQHDRTKHIEVDRHFIKEKLE